MGKTHSVLLANWFRCLHGSLHLLLYHLEPNEQKIACSWSVKETMGYSYIMSGKAAGTFA
jgi:hypothetical protein